MTQRLGGLLSLLVLTLPILTGAGLYKHVDKDGNITYTDKPADNKEEEFQPPAISNVETVKPAPRPAVSRATGSSAATAGTYSSFTVTAPAPDSTVRDAAGNVNIAFALEPDLQAGHKLAIFLDNKLLVTVQAPSHSLSNLDRGTHTVRGEIRDARDQTLMRSNEISFHLKRTAKN